MSNMINNHREEGSPISISIDAMGGDFGPSVTIPASIEAIKKIPNLNLILVGDEVIIRQTLSTHSFDEKRLHIQHASETVAMDESPAQALRSKKDSSMRVAINLVKEGKVQACVSAGNTGALMVTARFVLKTIPGVDRPAIVSRLPTINKNKVVRMLDLGANVDSTAESLFQFAVMGSILSNLVGGIENPKVALLNIGEEDIKGNEQVKQTAKLLSESNVVNYVGYIEGDKILSGEIDVVVCDGFVGNVSLKTIEGVAKLVKSLMKQSFMRNLWSKFVGFISKPVLKQFAKRIDPKRHNGASLIGLNGIVIKSHGGADAYAFRRAIQEAMICAKYNIPDRIRHEVEASLNSQTPPENE